MPGSCDPGIPTPSGSWLLVGLAATRAVEVGDLFGDAFVALVSLAVCVGPLVVVQPPLDGDASAFLEPSGVVVAACAEADDVDVVGAFVSPVDGDAVPADGRVLRG